MQFSSLPWELLPQMCWDSQRKCVARAVCDVAAWQALTHGQLGMEGSSAGVMVAQHPTSTQTFCLHRSSNNTERITRPLCMTHLQLYGKDLSEWEEKILLDVKGCEVGKGINVLRKLWLPALLTGIREATVHVCRYIDAIAGTELV